VGADFHELRSQMLSVAGVTTLSGHLIHHLRLCGIIIERAPHV
jgi:hypothetical protein